MVEWKGEDVVLVAAAEWSSNSDVASIAVDIVASLSALLNSYWQIDA